MLTTPTKLLPISHSFCLSATPIRTHRTMKCLMNFLAKYENATFRDIPNEPFLKVHGTTTLPVSKDPAIERTKRKQYYAAASSIDREVGKVLDELESHGQMANTLVVYTGDHGLNAGQHGMWEKGNATTPSKFP